MMRLKRNLLFIILHCNSSFLRNEMSDPFINNFTYTVVIRLSLNPFEELEVTWESWTFIGG